MTEYLTVKQAAERLHRHPNSIRTMLQKGTLSGIKLGQDKRSNWLITQESLDKLLNPSQ